LPSHTVGLKRKYVEPEYATEDDVLKFMSPSHTVGLEQTIENEKKRKPVESPSHTVGLELRPAGLSGGVGYKEVAIPHSGLRTLTNKHKR